MVVALETHLRGCDACAGDVAALRCTWAALDALPEVEPPADFARRVAARVAEEQWARRQSRPNPRSLWQGWLRSLTPAHGLGAAAIAALVAVGIALPLSNRVPGPTWEILNRNRERPAVTSPDYPPEVADPTLAPRVIARTPRWENGRWVGIVQVTPARALSGAVVRATELTQVEERLAGAQAVDLARGTMQAARPYALPIPLEASRLGAHVVMVGVTSPTLAQEYRKVVAFPVSEAAATGAVSLEFQGEDVYIALARLSAATRRPIVADAGLTGKVSRQIVAARPEQALGAVLGPLGYRWQAAGDSYVVTRY
jgi:hypothetical protein